MPVFYLLNMRTKIIIGFGIVCALILVLFVIGRITGVVQYFIAPTSSNEPNIKMGDKFFTTNLKTPGSYKFIAFKSSYIDSVNSEYNHDYVKGVHYVFRVCAVQGDIIEMKNSILFVNNKNFDGALNLKNQFKISNKEFYIIEEEDLPQAEGNNEIIQTGDSTIITFARQHQKKYEQTIKFTPYINTDTLNGPFKWLDKNTVWTIDNFGPLKIPADCYFVMGDNRHFAMDSRYTGFVKKQDITGVVIGK